MKQAAIKSDRMNRRDLALSMLARCSSFFGYSEKELRGKCRTQELNQARQISMAVIHELSGLTLAEVGLIFGRRDHGTVLWAVKCVTGKQKRNKLRNESLSSLKEDWGKLRALIISATKDLPTKFQ